jgi:hypothetical protein
VSLSHIRSFVEDVHILTSERGIPFKGPNTTVSLNGLYVFFEIGQKIVIKSKEYTRIVRIGINEKPNNFRSRIRGHYDGNIEGSVFRENIGWALLESRGKKPLETYRTKINYKKENSGGGLEREISDYFSKAFTYKAFRIDYDKLATCEDIMIAAFSIYYQWKVSKNELDTGNWLGQYSYSQQSRIKRSGLWNSEGVLLINGLSLSSSARIEKRLLSSSKLKIVLQDLTQSIV